MSCGNGTSSWQAEATHDQYSPLMSCFLYCCRRWCLRQVTESITPVRMEWHLVSDIVTQLGVREGRGICELIRVNSLEKWSHYLVGDCITFCGAVTKHLLELILSISGGETRRRNEGKVWP